MQARSTTAATSAIRAMKRYAIQAAKRHPVVAHDIQNVYQEPRTYFAR